MIVDGDRERLLGVILADAMLIELPLDLGRLRDVELAERASWFCADSSLSRTLLQRTMQLSQM